MVVTLGYDTGYIVMIEVWVISVEWGGGYVWTNGRT